MIKFNNVSYNHPDGTNALNNINLDIPEKSITAIVGNNGAGKTTLVKHIKVQCTSFSFERPPQRELGASNVICTSDPNVIVASANSKRSQKLAITDSLGS